MERSKPTRLGLILAGLWMLGATACVPNESAPVASPAVCHGCNLVLISMDTLRADHVGAYGYDRPTTPNIDAMAKDSVVFENAVSQSAWTRPTHASMLTGLYPAEHGILGISDQFVLPSEIPTLASVLSSRGYEAVAFTGGGNMAAAFGFDRGFRSYRAGGRYLIDSVAEVEDWLADRRDGKFFMLFHGFDAHRPYRSDPVDRVALGLADERPHGLNQACKDRRRPANLDAFVDEYDAAIRKGDRAVGRLLRALERNGLIENTVVVFTSDHGEEFFDHGGCFHIETLYREILGVPLIVRMPGAEPARIAGVVPASVAIAPTALELLGLGKGVLPGPSLAGAVADGGLGDGFRFVISETRSIQRKNRPSGYVRALTTDTDKLVHWVDEDRLEYFDLRTDPRERSALPGGLRARYLKIQMALWFRQHPPLSIARRHVEPGRALKRRLRALGYVD